MGVIFPLTLSSLSLARTLVTRLLTPRSSFTSAETVPLLLKMGGNRLRKTLTVTVAFLFDRQGGVPMSLTDTIT